MSNYFFIRNPFFPGDDSDDEYTDIRVLIGQDYYIDMTIPHKDKKIIAQWIHETLRDHIAGLLRHANKTGASC